MNSGAHMLQGKFRRANNSPSNLFHIIPYVIADNIPRILTSQQTIRLERQQKSFKIRFTPATTNLCLERDHAYSFVIFQMLELRFDEFVRDLHRKPRKVFLKSLEILGVSFEQ